MYFLERMFRKRGRFVNDTNEKRTAPAQSVYIPSKPQEVPDIRLFCEVFIFGAAISDRHAHSFQIVFGWAAISRFERGGGERHHSRSLILLAEGRNIT